MKKVWILLVILSLLVGTVPAMAQQAAPGANVTLTGARGDAATRCDSASAAGSQVTFTFVAPPAGQSNYVTMLGVWGLESGAPSQVAPTQATMTGIAGTTPKLLPLSTNTPAIGAQGMVIGGFVPLATPIKMSTGTAGTIVGPATPVTNVTQEVVACYYQAP